MQATSATFAHLSPPAAAFRRRSQSRRWRRWLTVRSNVCVLGPYDPRAGRRKEKRLPFADCVARRASGAERCCALGLGPRPADASGLFTMARASIAQRCWLGSTPAGLAHAASPPDLMLLDAQAPWQIRGAAMSDDKQGPATRLSTRLPTQR